VALDPKSGSLVQDALTIFNHAKEKRRPLVGKWVTNYHVTHNRTWTTARPPGHPRTEIPEIYPILASIVAWETDMTPQFKVAPNVPPFSPYIDQYSDLARDLEWILNTNYETLDYASEVAQVLWDGEMYGIGYGKTTWEPSSSGGLGDAYLRRVDPFNMYLDPDAKSWKDLNYIFEVKQLSKQEISRRFPKANLEELSFKLQDTPNAPTQLDKSGSTQGHRPNPGSLPNASPPATSTATNVTRFGGKTGSQPRVFDDEVTLVELWYRTQAPSGLKPSTEDATPETPNIHPYKDEWRCLVFSGEQVLLNKSADEIFGHGQHPYARYCPLEEGELYGYSLVEQLAPMQIAINRLFAAVEHNAWLTGNPILVHRAGDTVNITNRPGERMETQDPNQDIRWLVPPPISMQHISVIDKMIEEMERVSGISAIMRGQQPQGRPSEGLVNSVQDSAFVRVRQRLRNFERFLRESGFMLATIITEFYDQSRVMSRVGSDDESPMTMALQNQHFYTVNDDDGTKDPMRFNLSVRAGAFGAIGREARAAMYERYFAMGAIDAGSLLRLSQVPNWKDIEEKVNAEKAAAGTEGQPPTQRAAARR